MKKYVVPCIFQTIRKNVVPVFNHDVPVLFLTEHHILKAYWGSGGITPLFL
jgi:hypothetical protein